jgi:hypothetical protein
MLYRNRAKFVWICLGSLSQIIRSSGRHTHNSVAIIDQRTAAHTLTLPGFHVHQKLIT